MQTANVSKLEHYLDLVSARHGAVATNIANIDTPAYHTRDFDFRAELQRALSSTDGSTKPELHEVSGLVSRPDGNNVSMDRESLLLAESQLQYRVAVQLLRTEFRRIQTAINEGK